jgi:glycosyltransferase involved in cell wall biosynthesis
MKQNASPSVLMIMLCIRCTLGGAEKRYARVFEQLVAADSEAHYLLINRTMLELLQSAECLVGLDDRLIVLDPPFRRFASGPFRTLAALLDALWFAWQCERAARRVRPDVIHPILTGVYLSLPTCILHPAIAHVLSAYSYQFVSYRDRWILGFPIGATLKQYAMRRADTVETLTEAIATDLIDRGIDGDKVISAPCSFTDYSRCKMTAKKEPWIVFLGRFVAIKNPLLLAQAAPLILPFVPNAHFFFLGAGPLRSKLEALIDELGISSSVEVRFEPKPTRILNKSSIFVSLQEGENYPSQALLEAMACGNAIVATDVGETRRLVDEENGIRIPLAKEALAESIVELLKDPRLLQKQQMSRQRVLSRHTPERFFEHITHVYRQAAKGVSR